MPLRRTDEQKAARDAGRQTKEAADARGAFLQTPLGQAVAAKERGDRFHEVQIPVGHARERWSTYSAQTQTTSHADLLGAIEAVGWQMEHVGYYYMVTGEATHNTVLSAAKERTAVTGTAMGIYLFRNTTPPGELPRPAPVAPPGSWVPSGGSVT